jgi:ribonucleoside-diphosphate reductase alpha chain
MKYNWLNDDSRSFLANGYLKDGQTVEDRVLEICNNSEKILGIEGFSSKLEDYVSRGWVSFSTPVWANFGRRALPISCFSVFADDTMESILYANSEIGMMSKQGGGTAIYLGELRPRGAKISTGGKSEGAVHFAKLTNAMIDVCKQADVRRGSCAVYLPIDHGDIQEFLEIGSEGNPIQDLQYGVCISDSWMEEMIDGDSIKRKIWAKVIESRINKGFPYLFFTDEVNRSSPEVYKKYNKKIHASNLCSEIALSTDDSESFVCCLSSVNLVYYDEWKNTDLIETMVYFLDSVMTEFINKSESIPFLDKAVRFAKNQRALGLGVLGWHSYLQKNMIPLESIQARSINKLMFKDISEKSRFASEKMAITFGQSDFMSVTNRRHSTLNAIAPTKSSSFILGQVSMGIEPIKSNYFIKDLAKSKTIYKNQYLVDLLGSKGMNTDDVWESILRKDGSVQHLDFLSEDERNVFKTFMEVSQLELVIQNADRQKFVDQAISFNLSVHPSTAVKDINKVIIEGWKLGMKTFYYQFSENSAQAFNRDIVSCVNCEG